MKKVNAMLVAFVLALIFFASLQFEPVHADTNFYGKITSDTTWLKQNSPYVLTGAVEVMQGVTLTIQPGVTVNLGVNYIQIDGTLIARGNTNDQITFNGATIYFENTSSSWNQQTGSGCIIENALVGSSIYTIDASPKIDDNTITSTVTLSGSSIVTGNTIRSDLSVYEGSPQISNNLFINSLVSTYSLKSSGYVPVISDNTMTGQGIKCYGGTGIGGYAYIYGNSISGCDTAIFGGASLIERNYIFNNQLGIDTLNGIINNNTITNNAEGINIARNEVFSVGGHGEEPNNPTLNYNNLYSNTKYSVYMTASNNVDGTYNWWGTTDPESIQQQLYDYRNDFGIGNLTFTPFLTAQNNQAMPDANTPTPTPSSNTSFTSPSASSPTQAPQKISSAQTWLAHLEVPLLLAIIAVLVVVIAVLLFKRKPANR